MQQILEYSFARVLVRLMGVVLTLVGLRFLLTLISYLIYIAEGGRLTAIPYSDILGTILPSAGSTLAFLVFGIYLARDGHILARILVAGLHGRCRRCGYDIRSVTAPTCPECGAPIRADTPTGPTGSTP